MRGAYHRFMDAAAARRSACELLIDQPRRLAHSIATGDRATVITRVISGLSVNLVVQAAYLHDIGYAGGLRVTGCHSLDGARWLAGRGESELAGLVAHHSAATFEVAERRLDHFLSDYLAGRQVDSDVLTYCDMTTGPAGEPMILDERIADIRRRYPETTHVRRAIEKGLPDLRAAVGRVEMLLTGSLVS